MSARRSQFVMLLATVAIMASTSWVWDHQQIISRGIPQRFLAEQGDGNATCEEMLEKDGLKSGLNALPDFGGLQVCVNANFIEIVNAITSSSTCNLDTFLPLLVGESKYFPAFMEVIKTIFGGIMSSNSSGSANLKTTLALWSANSTKLTGFCNIMNTQAAPCIEEVLAAFIPILERDAMCCHGLYGYVELLKLLVPAGLTLEQVLFDVVNGLHQTMCTTSNSDRQVCAVSLTSYLSDVISADESSLLSAIIFRAGVPLYAAAEKDVCSSLASTSLASGLVSGASIPYYAASCCVSGLSKLLQSLDTVMTHLSGSLVAELFTLITGRQDAVTKFTSLYPVIESCAFEASCTNPNFTLSSNTSCNAISDAVSNKTRSPSSIACKLVTLCDSNNVCSDVCEAGTASVNSWAADAITFQHRLSYGETLCFTQLPATHNSVITQARGYGNRDQLFNSMLNASNAGSYMRTSNQFLSLTDQLNLGARFLELDVHYFGSALRDAHCSNLGVSLIDTLSADMVISLKSSLEASGEDSSVEWTSDLAGCLPSFSGIRAEEQRLHNESLAEISAWLARHPDDFIVLFADIGDDVASTGQTDALLELYTSVFGDRLFTPSDFDTAGSDWNRFTLEDLIRQGKQVVLVSGSEANSLMFYSRERCTGWADIPKNAAGPAGTFFGEIMNAGKISSLGGGSNGVDTPEHPANVNASTLRVFVDAGVNFVAPDGLDGSTMAATIWSWAENEPDVSISTALVISGVDGRWHGISNPSSISHLACVSNSSHMKWKVVAKGSNCPNGFETGAPQLAVENLALLSEIRAEAGAATAQLAVDLGSLLFGK
ncbi:hypothetical protein GN958_ATG23400 [Phytophthora infestans]|uniref:PLC-like phosphodiesterase n=1 Tax=Phytophthora infestans TaxID=4787 RepID=A0A8S9TH37_PHYIN|nr:hypothetical protein GN958_ATG23400 [Phytophthora infestans]